MSAFVLRPARRAGASATFRIRGLRGLGVAPGRGEQPHGRRAVAWPRLSDSGSQLRRFALRALAALRSQRLRARGRRAVARVLAAGKMLANAALYEPLGTSSIAVVPVPPGCTSSAHREPVVVGARRRGTRLPSSPKQNSDAHDAREVPSSQPSRMPRSDHDQVRVVAGIDGRSGDVTHGLLKYGCARRAGSSLRRARVRRRPRGVDGRSARATGRPVGGRAS